MTYKIKNYSFNQAKKLNVEIKPSTNKNKKIDVFKNGEKIASIGAIGYKDYPTYLLENPEKAKEKRRLFNARFKKTSSIKNSNSYFAKKILW